MRIEQVNMGSYSGGFGSFKDFYSLEDYNDKNAPAVFYGLTSNVEVKKWINHRGFKIYIPVSIKETQGNFDISGQGGALQKINHDNLNILVYDEVWEYLVKSNGIENYKKVKFAWQDHRKCKPTPLGDKIYIHFSIWWRSESERQFFEKDKYIELFGDDLIFPSEWIPYNDLIENYFNRSFIHIITSPLPIRAETTGQAMGLMGRKTLCNWPNLNPSYELFSVWDLDKLIKRVNMERQKIGTIQLELANQVNDYFDFSDDWLYVDYWK